MHNLTAASVQPDVHFACKGLLVWARLGSGLLTRVDFSSKLLKCCFYFVHHLLLGILKNKTQSHIRASLCLGL